MNICKHIKISAIALLSFFVFPFIAFAQPHGQTLFTFFNTSTASLSGLMLRLGMAWMVLYFLIGVYTYVLKSDGAEDKKKGISMMIHGLAGIAIFISIWGIINMAINTFDLGKYLNPFNP